MLAIFGTQRVPPSAGDDDDLDELPPLDGDEDEVPESIPDLEESESEELERESDARLDDTTSEGDPPDVSELEGDETERGWVGEADDSPDLDLGETGLPDLSEDGTFLDDSADPPIADDEFGIGEHAEQATLDSAEEGPLDPDEQLRDEDLPAMDADADEEQDAGLEETALLDDRFVDDEPLGLPWATEPWESVGPGPGFSWMGLSGGATAIACAARGALVAGRSDAGVHELIRVDLEGTLQGLAATGLAGARVAALSVQGETVAAVLDGGRVMLSDNGGERFGPSPAFVGVAVADVVVAPQALWARTRTGGLLLARPGKALERCAVPGLIVSLARSGPETILALSVDDEGRPAALIRGTAEGAVAWEALQAPYGRPSSALAARDENVAFGTPSSKGGVVRRGQDGQWRRLAWEGLVTALAFVDAEGTLVAATYSDTDDTTALVRVDPAGSKALVARVGAARGDVDGDGRAVAIASDDARGVVWVAGGFGVAVFAIR